jgi:hypothetical protein
MAFRDILLMLDTYPEPTPASAIDDAVALAQAMGAKISALACAIMLPGTGNILADTLLDVPTILVEEGGKSLSNAEAVLSRFQRAAEERGIFQERILERFPKSAVSDLFIEHAHDCADPRRGDCRPIVCGINGRICGAHRVRLRPTNYCLATQSQEPEKRRYRYSYSRLGL